MKAIDVKDLRTKNVAELEKMVDEARSALFKSRRDLVFRRVTDTASLKVQRHNIARILTVIGEKQREGK